MQRCSRGLKGMQGSMEDRSLFLVACVASHFCEVFIWRHMKRPSEEKSHLSVQYVLSYWYKVMIWKPIKGSMEQRSHLTVPNVACHLHRKEFWRRINRSTQDRSYLLIPNVTCLFTNVAFKKHDMIHTRENEKKKCFPSPIFCCWLGPKVKGGIRHNWNSGISPTFHKGLNQSYTNLGWK